MYDAARSRRVIGVSWVSHDSVGTTMMTGRPSFALFVTALSFSALSFDAFPSTRALKAFARRKRAWLWKWNSHTWNQWLAP